MRAGGVFRLHSTYSNIEVMNVGKKTIALYLMFCSGFLMVMLTFSRSVEVISQSMPPERSRYIVIDAGHGEPDGGAVSCTGKKESDYNLEIAKKLNDLMLLLGYRTKMVRTEENSVYITGTTIAQKKMSDLKQRVKIVNETADPILISIHQNHFPDSRYKGAQVFYANTPGSQMLAEQIQRSFIMTINPGSKRMVKRSTGVYLMEQIKCPAVLVECGFLSNPSEERKLTDDKYQQKICCVIAAAVSGYLSNT